ncbi:MAG: manganese efflux pump MntP family protein [Methanomicrobiales archaeon]|nr:manganese efflux pump MntP family protein [Methanomicrobiales archaeon]
MDLLTVMFIAIGLAMDCFAISIAIGARMEGASGWNILPVPVLFGSFQFAMCIGGWFAGNNLAHFVSAFDHWIAFSLLLLIGVKMLYESRGEDGCRREGFEPPAAGTLLILAVATSIDALGVGLSLALLDGQIGFSALIIGLVSFVFSFVGMKLGGRLCGIIGRKVEVFGGLILIGIGTRILFEHLR